MDGSANDHHNIEMKPTHSSQNLPIFVENVGGEVRIQLEGSHTTTSETEPSHSKEGTCVQFNDQLLDQSKGSYSSSQLQTIQHDKSSENLTPRKQWSDDDVGQTSQQPLGHTKFQARQADLDLIQIEQENEAIGERFKQIMDMFEAFTKNLESLEMQTSCATSRSEADEARINSFAKHKDTQFKAEDRGSQKLEMVTKSTFALYEATAVDRNSISTNTSGLELQYQHVPCQTSLNENFSIGPTSIMRSTSFTSRSELQQSLNNYARADNALNIITPAAGHPLKTAHSMQTTQASTVVVEEPCSQPFNTIHIEAMSATSSTALQRPPLCQRLWDVITDFCAAICLCLQVNRDCIFCLGFFAAFVVSASFLTAFFYRTLSVSPPLWQSPQHRFVQSGTGIIGGFNPRI